jgi:hypothetical protein
MVTPPDIEARILRLYHAEKWLIGTIAQQLHVHYSVVSRVLAQAGLPRPGPPPRKSWIDPYLAFIRQTRETFPALTASRLYVMVRERGYRGSPDHFRHLIACHRPRPKAEAYLRLRSLPGEQGQVDWGHFGHLEIGRARRPLMAFVMVLLAPDLPALLPRRPDGELFARPCRRLQRLARYSTCPAQRFCSREHNRCYVPGAIMWLTIAAPVIHTKPARLTAT